MLKNLVLLTALVVSATSRSVLHKEIGIGPDGNYVLKWEVIKQVGGPGQEENSYQSGPSSQYNILNAVPSYSPWIIDSDNVGTITPSASRGEHNAAHHGIHETAFQQSHHPESQLQQLAGHSFSDEDQFLDTQVEGLQHTAGYYVPSYMSGQQVGDGAQYVDIQGHVFPSLAHQAYQTGQHVYWPQAHQQLPTNQPGQHIGVGQGTQYVDIQGQLYPISVQQGYGTGQHVYWPQGHQQLVQQGIEGLGEQQIPVHLVGPQGTHQVGILGLGGQKAGHLTGGAYNMLHGGHGLTGPKSWIGHTSYLHPEGSSSFNQGTYSTQGVTGGYGAHGNTGKNCWWWSHH